MDLRDKDTSNDHLASVPTPGSIFVMTDDIKIPRFTARQMQVVTLIARGCSNVEIADSLGVSPRTAKAHCDVLRSKLRVSKRRQIPLAFRSATGHDPLDLGGFGTNA
jgi:DNA-binding NarL/FixJ family response regulator